MKNELSFRNIFFLLSFFHAGTLISQYIPMVEESKYWIYYDFQLRARPTTGFLITLNGDTIVNNMLYKNVYKYELDGEIKTIVNNEPAQFVATFPYVLKDKKLIAFIREDIDQRQVFCLPIKQDSCSSPMFEFINHCNDIIFCDTSEHLLFDFSLVKNDTLNYCGYEPLHWDPIPAIVDSIINEMHFGKLRNTFYTYGIRGYMPNLMAPGQYYESKVQIIEGVGFKIQGIFNYKFGYLYDYCEGDLNVCNITNSTNEQRTKSDIIKLYPNPTNEYLRIESNEVIRRISLINTNSMQSLNINNENLIDMSTFADGFYVCKIELKNGNTYFKKILKVGK